MPTGPELFYIEFYHTIAHPLRGESLSDMTETVAKMVVKGGENN